MKIVTSGHTPPFYRRRTSEIGQSEESTMMCAIRPSMLFVQLASCLWHAAWQTTAPLVSPGKLPEGVTM